MNLQHVSKEQALQFIKSKFGEETVKGWWITEDTLEYWAYPQVFGSTAGPFGGIGGQAMTTFTIEAWVCGCIAVLFCGGKVLKVTDKWEGPGSVRI